MALTHTPQAEFGTPCPDFRLPGVDGKTYSLSDFPKGHALVVMFICNHCPYVQAIEDRLIELGRDLKRQNVSVVGICSNDEISYPADSFDNLKKRFFEKNYSFVYLHDKTQEVARKFGAVCTPDFFVYDREHRLAYRGRLDDSWKDPTKVTQRELYQAALALEKGQDLSGFEQLSSMGCSIKWLKETTT